jgi:transposase
VGLDVHARSVAAAAIDSVTGEALFQSKLTPSHEHIGSWVQDLPGPVVAYEAGPTGFGLYRSLTAAGIRCEVAAPEQAAEAGG